MDQATQRFDAIVIGSGVSGGWAAKELTEKGMTVLMLDRGVMVEHGDYDYDGKAPFEIPARDIMPAREIASDYFISTHGYVSPGTKKHYNNDRLNPYAYEEGDKFYWIRPAAVGGKSLIWGRWSFRWSADDFAANAREAIGTPWPIGYDDIAPWYDHVERHAGVSGSRENLDYLPDSQFQPPMPMNIAEIQIKQALESAMPGRKMINARLSNMTEDKLDQGRSKCQFRNQCGRGCGFGAYFSTQSSTLPAARATGRLTLQSDAVVSNLVYDRKGKRVTGVRYIDTTTGEAHVVHARVVFLCASAMASVQILMNSRPDGSGQSHFHSNGSLGAAVMDHIHRTGVSGELPGLEQYIEYGRRPGGIYVPRFRNLARQEDVPFRRGYGYQGSAYRAPMGPNGFGASMKHGMRKYGPWRFGMGAFGECLPHEDNRVSLHPAKVDRFGIPQMLFNVTFRDNEMKMMDDAIEQGKAMLVAAGLKNVEGGRQENVPGDGIHEMGGARMGADPMRSVVDQWGQAHDAPNLFIADGSIFPSQSCVNPSLTFMALAARAADRAVAQVKAGAV